MYIKLIAARFFYKPYTIQTPIFRVTSGKLIGSLKSISIIDVFCEHVLIECSFDSGQLKAM